MSNKIYPKFTQYLLHPRYWLIWLGAFLLFLVVQLPSPILYKLGSLLGRYSIRFLKRRLNIVERNIELCFPHLAVQ